MAVADTTLSTPARTGGSFINRMFSAITAWNQKRQTRNALNRLSDRALEDIGLTREDIDRAIL